MKKLIALLLAALMLTGALSGCGTTAKNASADQSYYTVGICQLVEHVALDAATQGFQDALVAKQRAAKGNALGIGAPGAVQIAALQVVNQAVAGPVLRVIKALAEYAKRRHLPLSFFVSAGFISVYHSPLCMSTHLTNIVKKSFFAKKIGKKLAGTVAFAGVL